MQATLTPGMRAKISHTFRQPRDSGNLREANEYCHAMYGTTRCDTHTHNQTHTETGVIPDDTYTSVGGR